GSGEFVRGGAAEDGHPALPLRLSHVTNSFQLSRQLVTLRPKVKAKTAGEEWGHGEVSMTEARPAAPLWRKIAQTLSAEIVAQDMQPGAKLPTEAQLATRFDVNRHTVRRAIESLVRTGLVRVEQGRGSFVAEDVLGYEVSARTRFSEWIRRHNKEPSGQVLRIREVAASRPVA